MTTIITTQKLAEGLRARFPSTVMDVIPEGLLIKADTLVEVCRYLKAEPELAFDYLTSITAVDYLDYFELVYHLASLEHNHMAVLKVRCYGRSDPEVPSVVAVWKTADLQEREIWDLMGVKFSGHPNLKRVLTWEGFSGHPLRKDFLSFDQAKGKISSPVPAVPGDGNG